MKLKYIYTLVTIVLTVTIVPVAAQTKKKAKQKTVKTTAKKPAAKTTKPLIKTAQPVQKSTAQNLGEAIINNRPDTAKNNPNTNSLSEEIVVTTAYKPVLADAVKIRINPDLNDVSPFKAPLSYVPLDKRLEQNTDIKQIEAMKRPVEKDSDLFNNYLKAGLGNLKTTYGEVYFNNGRDEALQVGAYLKHIAQNGGLNKQNSGNEEAGIFGKSIGKQNSLSGKFDYSYLYNYFYGFNPSITAYNLKPAEQHFSTISGEIELIKNYKDIPNDFTYALKAKGYLFNNAYQAKENDLVISGFLNETIGQFYAGLNGSVDFGTQQDSLYNINNSLIRINPYLKFQGDSYKIDAGVNIVDQFGSVSSFRVFPAVKLEYQIIPKYVRLFAEVKGDINKSTLLDFSINNPFLGKDVPLKNSVDQLDLAAGIKGTIIPQISFKVYVYQNKVKDMPLFISNFNFAQGYNKYTVAYDNGSAKVSGINTELDFRLSDDIDFFGKAEFLSYKMDQIPEAWNLPTKKLTGGASVRISNSFKINGNVFLRGAALDPYIAPGSSSPTVVKSFTDLGLGAEYKASNRIAIFVDANNLLNTNNQKWLYYSAYGFNIFGGIGVGF